MPNRFYDFLDQIPWNFLEFHRVFTIQSGCKFFDHSNATNKLRSSDEKESKKEREEEKKGKVKNRI